MTGILRASGESGKAGRSGGVSTTQPHVFLNFCETLTFSSFW